MIGLVLHAALIVTVIGAATSALVGLVAAGREGPRGGPPLVSAALWAPVAAAVVVLAAVLLPHGSFGLPDHCLNHPDHHLHVCLVHGAPMPAPLLSLVALVGLGLGGSRFARALIVLLRSERSVRRLVRSGRVEGGLVVLPGAEPLAFVAGVVRPRVFVSEGVLAEVERWGAVIAHERAHARQRDPLRRWLASLAAVFHWSAVSRPLLRALAEEQELRADRAAARTLGDPLRVAETIIDWSRSLRDLPTRRLGGVAMTFGAGPIRRRILALTTGSPPRRWPHLQRIGVLAGAAALLAPFALAPELHHTAETLLSLWGSH